MEITKVFADMMMRAAIEYCRTRNLPIDATHLSSTLRSQTHMLAIALRDAKEALNVGMDKIAEATFAATAMQAGIAAAKMYADEIGAQS